MIYSSSALKNKIIMTMPELTADQSLQQVRARGPIDSRPALAVRLLDMADAGTIHSRRERRHGLPVEVWFAGPRPAPEPRP